MGIDSTAQLDFDGSQQCRVILNVNDAADRPYDESVLRQTESLAQGKTQMALRLKSSRIHTVINHADSIPRNPRLLGMEVAKFPGNSKNGAGHGVCSFSKEPAARWKSREHVQFVAVFAVNSYGDSSQPRSGNCFNGAPVS